ESDPVVIRAASERQSTYIQTYKFGPQADLSQRLLTEIAQAKLCLLDPIRKAEYDRSLRAASGGSPPDVLPPSHVPPPVTETLAPPVDVDTPAAGRSIPTPQEVNSEIEFAPFEPFTGIPSARPRKIDRQTKESPRVAILMAVFLGIVLAAF